MQIQLEDCRSVWCLSLQGFYCLLSHQPMPQLTLYFSEHCQFRVSNQQRSPPISMLHQSKIFLSVRGSVPSVHSFNDDTIIYRLIIHRQLFAGLLVCLSGSPFKSLPPGPWVLVAHPRSRKPAFIRGIPQGWITQFFKRSLLLHVTNGFKFWCFFGPAAKCWLRNWGTIRTQNLTLRSTCHGCLYSCLELSNCFCRKRWIW